MGRGKNKNKIYIIDFGFAKRYKDKYTKRHIPFKKRQNLKGTARFASINVHKGHEAGRGDDLESLGYMLIFLAKGRLPW